MIKAKFIVRDRRMFMIKFQSMIWLDTEIITLYAADDYEVEVHLQDYEHRRGVRQIIATPTDKRMPMISASCSLSDGPVECAPHRQMPGYDETLEGFRQLVGCFNDALRVAEELSTFNFYEDYLTHKDDFKFTTFEYWSKAEVKIYPNLSLTDELYNSYATIHCQLEQRVNTISDVSAVEVRIVICHPVCDDTFQIKFISTRELFDSEITELHQRICSSIDELYEPLTEQFSYPATRSSIEYDVEVPKLYRCHS